MKGSRRAWRHAAAVWAAAVLVAGMLPTQGAIHTLSGGNDDAATVLGHLAAYVVLGSLLGGALWGWEPAWRRMLLAWMLAVALGALVELVQGPLPYRDAQAVDVVVNAAGAAAGMVLFSAAARVSRPRSRRG